MPHLITTTMQPDQQIEVDDAEYIDLKRQGLIHTEHPEQAVATAPATSKAVKTAASKEG